jgi:hypothetical protein
LNNFAEENSFVKKLYLMLMGANNRQQVIQKAHLEFGKDELKIGGINLLIYLHYTF